MPCSREQLEQRERQTLAPYAQFSADSRGRAYAVEELGDARVLRSAALPPAQSEAAEHDESPERLSANPAYWLSFFALFLYVGAEVSLSSGIPIYLHERFMVDTTKIGLLGTGVFFLALTIGRFSGGVILNWMKPKTFFAITCALSLLGLLCMFLPSATLAAAGFFLIGLGFANIFPLIFSIVIDRIPERANELSGLMVMAIVGGAIVPPIMGLVADMTKSVQAGFIVPLLAVLFIAWTSVANLRAAKA